jgi:hypothetical protein
MKQSMILAPNSGISSLVSSRLALALSAALCLPMSAQTTDHPFVAGQGDSSQVRTSDANWMAHTRFGMFIHFGLYSIPAAVWQGQQTGRNTYAEWIRAQWGWPNPEGISKEKYDVLLKQFNPVKFDADEWVSLAAKAGMKYFVITTKHHDGSRFGTRRFPTTTSPPRPSARTDATHSPNWRGLAGNTASNSGSTTRTGSIGNTRAVRFRLGRSVPKTLRSLNPRMPNSPNTGRANACRR